MSRTVAIVGGGVVGLCCADALLRRGFEVTVIDSDAERQGCSYGNGGIIVPSHFVPIASPSMLRLGLAMMVDRTSPFGLSRIPNLEMISWIGRFVRAANKRQVERASPVLKTLNLTSRDLYEELIGRLGVDVGFSRTGCLMLCKTEEGFRDEVQLAKKASALGLNVKVLQGMGLVEAEPGIIVSAHGGVLFRDDAHLTPAVFMDALRSYLEGHGVRFIEGRASGFESSGRNIRCVRTSEGDVEAELFVLAAGAWSGQLARKVGFKMPLLSGRGYGFTLPLQDSRPTIATILVEARIAVTPMLDGTRFVGTLELGPPEPGVSESRLQGMRRDIPDFYPSLHPSLETGLKAHDSVWHGHRPCSPDGLPYIGRSKRVENLIVATGHAMMGMSLGPVTGMLVGQVADGEETSLGLGLLAPERFG